MTERETTSGASEQPKLMPTATGYRLPGRGLAEDIRTQFRRANWPEQSETLVELHVERGVHEVRSGAPLPLDPHESKGDGYLLDDLTALHTRVIALRTRLGETLDQVDQARKTLGGLIAPLSSRTVQALIATVVLLTIIGVLALRALLSSSFDEMLFRSYTEGLDISDPATASREQAEQLVLLAASLLLGAKAAAVVGSHGQLSPRAKALLLLVAVVFSACLGIVRLTPGFSWAAIAVSGIELALLLSFSVFLIAVAGVLRMDSERQAAYQVAEGTLAAEHERAARLKTELEAAERAYETKRAAVAQREDDVRRLPLIEAAARSTVKSEALVTTLELISAAVKGTTAENPTAPADSDGGTP